MFGYSLNEDKNIVFYDSIKKDNPCIFNIPRNHESIFLVKKGQLKYVKNGAETVIKTGQVGYIARGSLDESSAYLCDETAYIVINFNFAKSDDDYFSSLPFSTVCSNGDTYDYDRVFDEVLSTFSADMPGKNVICNGQILQIIGMLYNEYKTDVSVRRKRDRIEKAVSYLKKNYYKSDLEISKLASLVNMSEKNFRRIFTDVYGKTPYAYLQEFRISRAETLLLYGSNIVSEVALQCGFSDVYSFSHSFKKHIGVSPTEYIKRRKN